MKKANHSTDFREEIKPPNCAHFLEEMTQLGQNFVKSVVDYAGAQFQVFEVDNGELVPLDAQIFISMEESVAFIKNIPIDNPYINFTVLPLWRSRWKPDDKVIEKPYLTKPIQYSVDYYLDGKRYIFSAMAYSETHAAEIAPALIADMWKRKIGEIQITSIVRF